MKKFLSALILLFSVVSVWADEEGKGGSQQDAAMSAFLARIDAGGVSLAVLQPVTVREFDTVAEHMMQRFGEPAETVKDRFVWKTGGTVTTLEKQARRCGDAVRVTVGRSSAEDDAMEKGGLR